MVGTLACLYNKFKNFVLWLFFLFYPSSTSNSSFFILHLLTYIAKFKCCYRNTYLYTFIYIFYCSPLCMYKERSPSSTTPFFIIIFPLLLLLLTTPFHNVKNIKKKTFCFFRCSVVVVVVVFTVLHCITPEIQQQ